MRKKITYGSYLLALILCQCTGESQELVLEKPALSSQNKEISDFLQCQGYDVKDAKFYSEHVVVEGDMNLRLDEIKKLIDIDKIQQNQRTSQYVINTAGIVTTANVYEIAFYIDASVGPIDGDWESAIRTATQNWEDLPNCRVSFNEVSSAAQADLVFYANTFPGLPLCAQYMASDLVAVSEFPANDQPGRWVAINVNDGSDNQANRETFMRHELGHVLGFRHDHAPTFEPTNSPASYNCGNAVFGANQLIGTPQNDASSLMRPGFTSTESVGFSSNDTKSATFLYPDGYFNYTVTNISQYYKTPTTRDVSVTIAYNPVSMYRFFVERLNPWGGSVLQSQEYNETLTTYSLRDVPLGSCRFRIRSQNYKGDFSITGSDISVTVQ